jgi:SAM-dependent methyltransferase
MSEGAVLTKTSQRSSIDRYLLDKPLSFQFWKDWRLNKKRNWITWLNNLPKQNGSILIDAGCGDSDVVSYLSTDHEFVIGFDLSVPTRNLSSKHSLLMASAEAMPFRSNICHCILSLQVAEHLPYPLKFIVESFRVLTNNGIVLFSTPTPKNKGAESESHFNVWERNEWIAAFQNTSFSVNILPYQHPIGLYWKNVPLFIKLLCGAIGGKIFGMIKMVIPQLLTSSNLKCTVKTKKI